MILKLLCIWLTFLFIVVIADARNHEPEMKQTVNVKRKYVTNRMLGNKIMVKNYKKSRAKL
jgi:hypothetical protein